MKTIGTTGPSGTLGTFDADKATSLLRLATAMPEAEFREGQGDAIRHIVEGRGRLLVVQRTGWGKSVVYFIATKLLRDAGAGPAILISPLLSLMRNQIVAAERMGLRARTINSDNVGEWEAVERDVRSGAADILLISPERLANSAFRDKVLAPIAGTISLLVVDEAHCISDWGHDFRPQYRLLERLIGNLPGNLRLLATTATANDRVMDDLRVALGPDLHVQRGPLHRPSLQLQTIRLPGQAERLAWLAEQVPRLAGSGVIYTLTVRDALCVAEWLQTQGVEVESYTGRTGDARAELEQRLLDNDLKALVATTALGMGFDKPDLGFVIHYQTPGSVVAYYQQVGRAGRAIDAAYGVLLSGDEETEITDYFIRSAFPTRDEVNDVLAALGESERGLSLPEIETRVNATRGRIEKTMQLLSLESPSPVSKQGSKWLLSPARLSESFWRRAERLTELRRTEQMQMQDYVDLESGHMAFLVRALDGDPAEVSTPELPPLPTETGAATIEAAIRFLRRTAVPIEPRRMWPTGGLRIMEVRGKIQPERQAEVGRALCIWGDAGWGTTVREGKYRDVNFSDELVEACRAMVVQWQPTMAPTGSSSAPASLAPPTWLTCVPSSRHPDLVPDFARRLADALGLPFRAALRSTGLRPEQKSLYNSAQQASNVDGGVEIVGRIPDGPVLLVDDVVDSKWTITVAAYLLLDAGSGPVWPLALADASGSGGSGGGGGGGGD